MATPTYFFYDLETSGIDPRTHRIMQFAGVRTTMDLEPIGDPENFLIQLSPEVMPDLQAIFVTGITPQSTLKEGMLERDALRHILEDIFTPDTIVVGFNSVHFDDEFIRFAAYRNFHDPYAWAYADGRSRWDLLDIVRLVRALRPEGIEWPFDEDGSPLNRLELIAAVNNITHIRAHDALSDVEALIAIARLIREKQPRMYEYLLKGRTKEAVSALVDPVHPAPFIYASVSFGKVHNFVSVAIPIGFGEHKKVVVYDLRIDPTPYLSMSVEELRNLRFATREQRNEPGFHPLPALEVVPNKCPVVAPYSTLRPEDEIRLGLERELIQHHLNILENSNLKSKLQEVFVHNGDFPSADDVDGGLYNGFINATNDKAAMLNIRQASTRELATLRPHFSDVRLPELWIRYKGRNAPDMLLEDELKIWTEYVTDRKRRNAEAFASAVAKLNRDTITNEQVALLESLRSWAS
jgi:exodeoxyribonuclease-1